MRHAAVSDDYVHNGELSRGSTIARVHGCRAFAGEFIRKECPIRCSLQRLHGLCCVERSEEWRISQVTRRADLGARGERLEPCREKNDIQMLRSTFIAYNAVA
jgi:hypothetical protein